MIVKSLKINKIVKNSKRYNVLFIGIMLYRLSLIFAFYGFVLKYYNDDFFTIFKLDSFLLSYVLFVFSAYFTVRMIKNRGQRMSGHLFLLAYLFSYVPTSVLCTYMWNDNLYSVAVSVFWIFTMLILSFGKRKVDRAERALIDYSPSLGKLFIPCVITIFIITLIIIYSFNGFRFSFSFTSLYDTRREMKSTISTLQGLVIYCAAAVCVPILIGVFLRKRKYLWLIAVGILQILMFMVGGDKFYLLVLIFGILLAIFYKKKYVFVIPGVLAIVIALATLFTVVTEGTFFEMWVYDIGVRRVLFTPAHLSYYYFDFCKVYPKVMFTDHQVISRILVKFLHMDIPYDELPIADVLGLHYWGETGKSNGGFGSAFSQVGYACLIIYPILFLCIGNIFDKITDGFNMESLMPLVCSLTIYLLDYSISGIELTYILFAAILFGLARGYLNNVQKSRKLNTCAMRS